jgi:malonyl CoA-acyl carrier protein transacylase
MATMALIGVGIYYEVGPGRVLAGLARRIDRSLQVISIDDVETKM